MRKQAQQSSSDAPLAEGNGSGIPYIYNEMKRHTLRPPIFNIGFDSFSIVLGRFGTEIAENQRWISKRTSRHLSRDEEALLLHARDNEEITVQDAPANLGIVIATAPRTSRERRYLLAHDAKPGRDMQ